MKDNQVISCKVSKEGKQKIVTIMLIVAVLCLTLAVCDLLYIHSENNQNVKIAIFFCVVLEIPFYLRLRKRIEVLGNLGISDYSYHKKYFFLSNIEIESPELTRVYQDNSLPKANPFGVGIRMNLYDKTRPAKDWRIRRSFGILQTGIDENVQDLKNALVRANQIYKPQILPDQVFEDSMLPTSVIERKNKELLKKAGIQIKNAKMVGGMDHKGDTCIPVYEFLHENERKCAWGVNRISLQELKEKDGKTFTVLYTPESLRVMEV